MIRIQTPALAALLCMAVYFLSPESAMAQRTNTGGGTTGIGATGGQAAGGGGTAAAGFGAGQGATAGFANGLVNAQAFSSADAFQASTPAQAVSGGFVGRNDTSGRFVGTSQAGTQNVTQQTPNFGNRATSQRRSNAGASSSSARNLNVVRPQLRVAFTHPTISQARVKASLEKQLARLSSIKKFDGIDFTIGEEGVVTLSGEVPTGNDAKLLAILTSMEPGVRKVENKVKALDYEAENPSGPSTP